MAIWLMTPMILLIWVELSEIRPIPSIDFCTVWLPSVAAFIVVSAILLASSEPLATCWIDAANSSIEALTSSTVEACSSATADRFSAAADSSSLDAAVLSAACRISNTMFARLDTVSLRALAIVPISSLLFTSTCTVRSPSETSVSASTTCLTGLVMLRVRNRASAMPTTAATMLTLIIVMFARAIPRSVRSRVATTASCEVCFALAAAVTISCQALFCWSIFATMSSK